MVRILVLTLAIAALARPASASTIVLDFEDRPDSMAALNFPSSYQGVTWTGWLEYAPYTPNGYTPDGVNAIYAQFDAASFTFPEEVFVGSSFSAPLVFDPRFVSRVYFELYDQGTLVHTSADLGSAALTFLPSGYAGLVDEVRVRTVANGGTIGSLMTPGGSAWVMDDVTFNTSANDTSAVPEPGTLGLLAVGLGAAWRTHIRRNTSR